MVESQDNESEESDLEVLAEYISNLEKLKAQSSENFANEGVKKSIKYFNKKIRKILTGTTQALEKIHYSVGKETSSVVGKG